MALARCETHEPTGRTQEYVVAKRPLNHPGAVICGIKDCQSPGLISLNEQESQAYGEGKRIFGYDQCHV